MPSSAVLRVERWLAEHRPAYLVRLRPGTTDDALDAFEARFGVRLPAAFREFYRWRDGQSADCFDSLQHNRMFMSLADIAATKEMLDGMIGADFAECWWRREWVPFLDNGGGDHLCIDLSPDGDGRVIAFWHDWSDRRVEHAGFGGWLAALAGSMDDGTLELA